MSLTPIAHPTSESELSVMLCTLEAHGIPAFVQGGGIGSLYPGPQIPSYNARRIMVPGSLVAEAREALQFLSESPEEETTSQPSILSRVRTIVEALVFGWFVPGGKRRSERASNSSSKPTP